MDIIRSWQMFIIMRYVNKPKSILNIVKTINVCLEVEILR